MLYRRAKREPDSTGLEKGAINLWVVKVEPDYVALALVLDDIFHGNEQHHSATDVMNAALEGTDDDHKHVYDGDSVFCAVCGKSRGATRREYLEQLEGLRE